MNLSISMWSYFRAWKDGRVDIPGFIREAKKSGAQGVELLDFFYKDVESDRAAALDALAETGLPCPIFSVSQNFAKPTAEEREVALGKIRFGVDEALKFGSGVVRVYAGDVTEGISFDDAFGWIVEGLSAGSQYAAERGVKLGLENHGKLAGRSDQVKRIVTAVRERSGVDALGANPDTGNFVLVGQDSVEAVREVAPIAHMVHFKDFEPAPEGWEGFAYESLAGKKFVGKVLLEGAVDLRGCVTELAKSGYSGWMSVEYEGEEDPMTAGPRCVRNGLETIQSVLASV